jgi:hypothetical protein
VTVGAEALVLRDERPAPLDGRRVDQAIGGVAGVVAPTIDVQDERWPMQPRRVVITADEVREELGSIGPTHSPPCAGVPTPGMAPAT